MSQKNQRGECHVVKIVIFNRLLIKYSLKMVSKGDSPSSGELEKLILTTFERGSTIEVLERLGEKKGEGSRILSSLGDEELSRIIDC